jgi:DNA-binding response OmpR family regulator
MNTDLFVGKRILIVGDNSQSFDHLKNILDTTNASLLHTENEKDAVEICKDINPDVILLDRQLKNSESYDVIRQIITLQPNKCVIVLTEDSGSDDKDVLLKLGCKEFLVKPVAGNVLLETLKKYFHNY